MKLWPIFLLAGCLATCLTSPVNAGVPVTVIGGSTNNGNLDLTYAQEIVPAFFLPKPQVWVNVGTRAISGPYEDEMSSEPWAGPAPTPVTTDGTLNPPFPDGCAGPDCAVFFKAFSGGGANGAMTGHLYQDNPATPGASYVLTGWAGAEANLLATDLQIALEFLDAGNVVIPASGQVVSLIPTIFIPNGEAFNYKEYTALADAPVGAVTVRARVSIIGGSSNPAGGGQAFVVDDFALTEEVAPPPPPPSVLEIPTLDPRALAALALLLAAAAIWALRGR
jgi:hypothetical protein